MDLLERRRNLLGGKKKLYLYQAGWSNVQNCSIINTYQCYAFQSNYLLLDPSLDSSLAYAHIIIVNIADLALYKKLCIRYYCNVGNGDIHVGSGTMGGGVYGNVINGIIVANTIATVSFDINNIWKCLYIGGSNAAPSTSFRVYGIWLE